MRATIPLLLLSSLLALPPSARADDAWVGNILEEDDFWAPDNRDRHYTHGIRYSLTTGDLHDRGWQRPFDWLAAELPVFAEPGGADVVRRYNLIPLGQNMYTPENGGLVNPDIPRAEQVLTVITILLVTLAALTAIFTALATMRSTFSYFA